MIRAQLLEDTFDVNLRIVGMFIIVFIRNWSLVLILCLTGTIVASVAIKVIFVFRLFV